MESSPRTTEERRETPRVPWRAIGGSLLLHGLALAAFTPLAPVSPTPQVRLHASLRHAPAVLAPSEPTLAEPIRAPAARPPARAVALPPPVMPKPAQAAVSPASSFATSTEPLREQVAAKAIRAGTGASPQSPEADASAHRSGTPAGAGASPQSLETDAPEAAGLRQYRLALASEARRFRHYPEPARRAGLAGTAEIRVAVAAEGGAAQTELSRSSGHAVLDAAALDMLGQAAKRVELPAALRGRSVSVLLPVSFEIEE